MKKYDIEKLPILKRKERAWNLAATSSSVTAFASCTLGFFLGCFPAITPVLKGIAVGAVSTMIVSASQSAFLQNKIKNLENENTKNETEKSIEK